MDFGGMMQAVAGLGRLRAEGGKRPPGASTGPALEGKDASGGSAAAADEALLSLVNGRYRYAQEAKVELLETWATCLAFFCGEQWRSWDERQRRLVQPTRIPSWRVLPVYNQLPGVVDMASAKLSRSRQLPRARPDEANDPEDRARAERGTQALRGWWHHEDLELLEHEANVGRILFGCSFFHLYWDPARLAKIPVPDLVSGKVRPEYAPVGQVCVEVLTPFDVFPEPCEGWRDVSWCIVARRRPLHWFRSVFGEAGAQVEAESGEAENVYSGLIPGGEGRMAGTPPPGDGMATLKVYYEKPCRAYPQGRTVMVAGDQVLFRKDALPLPFRGMKNPLPVKMLGYRHVPKRLWPKGLIEECVSPQRELNRGLGNLSEWLRLHRGPKWLVPKGAKVDPKAITSAPDEVIEYSEGGGGPPQPIPPTSMPGWLAQYPAAQREEMRHLAGQHEVSEGQVPTGVSAASAIQLLQQSENTRLSSPALLGKAGLEDLSAHALVVMTERYREPRVVTSPLRAGQQETAILRGAELGPLEVIVELAEGVEDNDAVRQQQLFDWLRAGLLELVATPMGPVMLQLLRDIGQGWIAEIIERELPKAPPVPPPGPPLGLPGMPPMMPPGMPPMAPPEVARETR
jgi:hypothetical protein